MSDWKTDNCLRLRLSDLVGNGYKHKEILAFSVTEFKEYPWSIRTLQRRLKYFSIKSNDAAVTPEELLSTIKVEMAGPGCLLGYRSMHRKIRNHYKMLVKRKDVYLGMNLIAPETLAMRALTNNRKKFKKRVYTSKGSNWVWSVDGHDKLSGRLKSEFPFGIHGGIDTFSRKVLWLAVWPSNCNPILPAKLFYDAIIEHGYVPCKLRSDRGSENVIIAAMQDFLTDAKENRSNHLFGSSMTNQVIEQWWKGFRERHGEFYKSYISSIAQSGIYDETKSTCRVLMAVVFIPLLQQELNVFASNWNTHRIRKQNIYRPCGVPNFLYEFPADNGGQQCGIIPKVSKLDFLKDEVQGLKNMQFVTLELQNEILTFLRTKKVVQITLSNASHCYALLLEHFIDRQLDFVYS